MEQGTQTQLKHPQTIKDMCRELRELLEISPDKREAEHVDRITSRTAILTLRWSELKEAKNRTYAQDDLLEQIEQVMALAPEVVAAQSGDSVERAAKEQAKPVAELKVTRKRTPKAKSEEPEKPEDQSVMVCLNMTNGTFKLIESEPELVAAKNDVLRDPSNFRLVSGRAVVPTITWG